MKNNHKHPIFSLLTRPLDLDIYLSTTIQPSQIKSVINVRTRDNSTPLIMALLKGYFESVLVLLKHNPDVTLINNDQIDPLIAICSFTPSPSDLNVPSQQHQQYSSDEVIGIIEKMVEMGADVNHRATSGLNALMICCFDGKFEIAHHLITVHGIDPMGAILVNGATALSLAIQTDGYVVREGKNNNTNQANQNNSTNQNANTQKNNNTIPISYQRQNQIVKLLLERGADPNTTLSDGTSPLMLAVKHFETNPALIDLLLSYGSRVDILKKTTGESVFHIIPTIVMAAWIDNGMDSHRSANMKNNNRNMNLNHNNNNNTQNNNVTHNKINNTPSQIIDNDDIDCGDSDDDIDYDNFDDDDEYDYDEENIIKSYENQWVTNFLGSATHPQAPQPLKHHSIAELITKLLSMRNPIVYNNNNQVSTTNITQSNVPTAQTKPPQTTITNGYIDENKLWLLNHPSGVDNSTPLMCCIDNTQALLGFASFPQCIATNTDNNGNTALHRLLLSKGSHLNLTGVNDDTSDESDGDDYSPDEDDSNYFQRKGYRNWGKDNIDLVGVLVLLTVGRLDHFEALGMRNNEGLTPIGITKKFGWKDITTLMLMRAKMHSSQHKLGSSFILPEDDGFGNDDGDC